MAEPGETLNPTLLLLWPRSWLADPTPKYHESTAPGQVLDEAIVRHAVSTWAPNKVKFQRSQSGGRRSQIGGITY